MYLSKKVGKKLFASSIEVILANLSSEINLVCRVPNNLSIRGLNSGVELVSMLVPSWEQA